MQTIPLRLRRALTNNKNNFFGWLENTAVSKYSKRSCVQTCGTISNMNLIIQGNGANNGRIENKMP
jgi:hypothetical protein